MHYKKIYIIRNYCDETPLCRDIKKLLKQLQVCNEEAIPSIVMVIV
jgi:hypothetical protein